MAKKEKIDFSDIPEWTDADFKRARRVTRAEHDMYRKALSKKLGRPFPSRMGRPSKGAEKYVPISFRVPPLVLTWLKKQAKLRGIGYQTVIRSILVNEQSKRGAA